ncbi:MAG: DUF47 family protein [Cellulomonadaceae bacterium]|nr:DUF47 family protein [Cellulomonadaceae bacterium]
MAFKLTPRDTTFFDQFGDLAQYTVEAADLLEQMLTADKSTRKDLAKKIADVETQADAANSAIMTRLNSTFVTPLDRDDIYDLSSSLDDCVDNMEEAADLIVLYEVDELPARVSDVVAVLKQCAELSVAAMPRMRALDKLDDYWKTIADLERKGDKLHRKLIKQLCDEFTGDVMTFVKLKEIVNCLEDACDSFEEVADVVESIALKES